MKELNFFRYSPEIPDYKNLAQILDFLDEHKIPVDFDPRSFALLKINPNLYLWYIKSDRFLIGTGYGDFRITPDYFKNITEAFANEGIRIIYIYDHEIIDPKKWKIIQNFILSAVRKPDITVPANKCDAVIIGPKIARVFLEREHIQGFRSSSLYVGLRAKKDIGDTIKKGDLLMVFCIGYNYYANKKAEDSIMMEVTRVASLNGISVIGGISKCLSFFKKNFPSIEVSGKMRAVNKLKFYVDASHNDGHSLEKIGFEYKCWNPGFVFLALKDIPNEKMAGEVWERQPAKYSTWKTYEDNGLIAKIATPGSKVYELKLAEDSCDES